MGKLKAIRTAVRALPGPSQAGRGLTTIGRTGSVAAGGRNGVSWVRRAGGIGSVTGNTSLPEYLRKGIPWLIGGEVAWEFGRQLWAGLDNGKLYDDNGNVIGTLADGCLNLAEIMTDTTQIRALVRDLNALRNVRTDEEFEQSSFFTTFSASDSPYSLTPEGIVLVLAYHERRHLIGSDFLFDGPSLAAVYFDDIYVSCYDGASGTIIEPADTSWKGLRETLNLLCDSKVDDTLIADGYRQLIDLDGWLKLTEFIERLKYQGREPGSDRDDSMVRGRSREAELYSNARDVMAEAEADIDLFD